VYLAGTKEMINAYKILVGYPEGKRPLEEHVCKYRIELNLVLGAWS
jgi:hypothetical protein